MGDISARWALAWPAALAALTILLAALIGLSTGVGGWWAFPAYLGGWAAMTFIAVMIWVFVEVARLLPSRAEQPLKIIMPRLGQVAQAALLPAVIFPLFLGGYTWAKTSIAFSVGYGWERTWADWDSFIFGTDAWRWAHRLSPDLLAPAWTFYYAVVWTSVMALAGILIAVFASRRFAATYFTALMLSWLIGGIFMAYAISAAGPVFAHLADPELGNRFLPLKAELVRLLGPDDLVLKSQHYLEAGTTIKMAVKGGGVSAMPSMHIATATILILAAWRTRWLMPALLFWAMTFFGSVYLGYHYAVDAPVAALVAAICWAIARRAYREPGRTVPAEPIGDVALARL